jgi:superfamily II DNA or RNA helicase
MRRTFSALQRRILAFVAGGQCLGCGAILPPAFHADHVVPWSKGGPTTTRNGAALCRRCNLVKGTKAVMDETFIPREWQRECFAKAVKWLVTDAADRHFLVNATPAAGKTLMGAWLAEHFLRQNLIDRVITIAPRKEVVRKWAADFHRLTGRRMMKITQSGRQVAAYQPDICATWGAISDLLPEMQAICEKFRTLVLCDEHHHAAISAAWGIGADNAFANATFVVALTGTPVRSDGNGMQWFDLGDDGNILVPEGGCYTLTYRRAIEAGYCRPMVFHRHPGEFEISLPGGASFVVRPKERPVCPDPLFAKLVAQRCEFGRMVRSPLPAYHKSMLEWANRKLDELLVNPPEAGGLPNAGAMVAAPTIEMAEYFRELIEKVEGEPPIVVHSRVPDAEQLIEAFRSGTKRWLVSVNMVSEGVDIPRLRVIINLSQAETELYFRQLGGRAIRSAGSNDYSRAYMIIPEIDSFVQFARNYEEEQGVIPPPPQNPDAPERLRAGQGVAQNWTCDDCGALNPNGTTVCHNCGASPRQFTFSIDQAIGDRDGVIARGIELSEQETREGESIAVDIAIFDREQHPGAAAVLFNLMPPEGMARIVGLFSELDSWRKEKRAGC